ARRRVDGAAARGAEGPVVAARAVQATRRRARPDGDHVLRAGGRGGAPPVAAGARRRCAAADVPDGDRDAVSFRTVPLDELRRRSSDKWRKFPEEVLPSHIAEMDFPVAPPIEEALVAAVRAGDLGYQHAKSSGLAESFAAFAERRWGWAVDPAGVVAVPDVMVGVAELLRVLIPDGAGVVINPPVYPPFFSVIAETGRQVVEVPLAEGRLPLDGIRDALRAGAGAMLLCNPQNPTSHDHCEGDARAPGT